MPLPPTCCLVLGPHPAAGMSGWVLSTAGTAPSWPQAQQPSSKYRQRRCCSTPLQSNPTPLAFPAPLVQSRPTASLLRHRWPVCVCRRLQRHADHHLCGSKPFHVSPTACWPAGLPACWRAGPLAAQCCCFSCRRTPQAAVVLLLIAMGTCPTNLRLLLLPAAHPAHP